MYFTSVRDYKSYNLSQNFHQELYHVESHIFVDSCLETRLSCVNENKEYSLIKLYEQYLDTSLAEVPNENPNYKQLIAYMQPSLERLELPFQFCPLQSRGHSTFCFPLIDLPKHNLLSGHKKISNLWHAKI
jgi:hypothetical protein